ncbi:MAG: hypothetical protein AVDCRST_MAG73-893 [uncultured Thermomicrobiales bacterium]|uniref:Uncharacterized protein n=1 Tax=uncultured Thermomicrobiales bacterium TaxID=1645740 RepID=A0A6J4TT31_9BACT|nr:MAG: hypothetical protein AVDCRST_MAG73-893 [uncultured Thermomicrobiales bacterium]
MRWTTANVTMIPFDRLPGEWSVRFAIDLSPGGADTTSSATAETRGVPLQTLD